MLQERELQRVDGNERIKLDVRNFTATHKNLAEEVKQKTFRENCTTASWGCRCCYRPCASAARTPCF